MLSVYPVAARQNHRDPVAHREEQAAFQKKENYENEVI